MAITVGVFGAAGRMGSTVCRAVAADPELELIAAVDPGAAGVPVGEATGVDAGFEIAGKAEHLDAVPQVMVDFTHLGAARETLAWCAEHGVHAVVGTTGFSDED
ncbi:MAG: hypothetical protein ACTHN0_07795, partial [Aquihabitans sp.]